MESKRLLLFDLLVAQPVGKTKYHGGGEYIKTVFKYLVEKKEMNSSMIVFFDSDKFIDDWILSLIDRNEIQSESISSAKDLYERALTLSKQYKITIFCGLPHAYRHFSFPKDIEFVGVIHGLRDIEKYTDSKMFHYYSLGGNIKNLLKEILAPVIRKRLLSDTRNVIRICDVLIVDSNHTKYSLKVNFPDCANKEPLVFYPATQLSKTNNYNKMGKKYLMLISANRWLKNSYRTVMAIDNLYSGGQIQGLKTLVYGRLPNRIKRKIHNVHQFEFFDYVSPNELEKAYNSCEVFLYLTLNEGFGNVPMEAMKYGKTCVVSAVCSLPEVYKDTVYYCNPYDIMEIENRILQAVDSKIDQKKIFNRLEELEKRQVSDLEHLCCILSH